MSDGTPDLLQQHLQALYPNAEFELTSFSSGAWLLDMHVADRFFVISFSPRDGYGWDEVRDGDGLASTFSNAGVDVNDLLDKLTKRLGA